MILRCIEYEMDAVEDLISFCFEVSGRNAEDPGVVFWVQRMEELEELHREVEIEVVKEKWPDRFNQ